MRANFITQYRKLFSSSAKWNFPRLTHTKIPFLNSIHSEIIFQKGFSHIKATTNVYIHTEAKQEEHKIGVVEKEKCLAWDSKPYFVATFYFHFLSLSSSPFSPFEVCVLKAMADDNDDGKTFRCVP